MVVNTCAFIEEARQESIDVVLALADRKADGAEIVVTGCMAERYGDELAQALPEVDAVAGFGVPGHARAASPARRRCPASTCSTCPAPPATAPWAYVKVAEGCDKKCGFCAIPSFRGPQRSRSIEQVLDEVDQLVAGGAKEIVLVAQDLASYGRDQGVGTKDIVPLVEAVAGPRARGCGCSTCTRPSSPTGSSTRSSPPACPTSTSRCSTCPRRCCAACAAGVTASASSSASTGSAAPAPEAAFRSNFIVGYPGETEADHDQLLAFVDAGAGRLVRVLRLLAGGRHLRRRPRRHGAAGAHGRAPGRAPRAAGRHHRGPA